MTSRHIFVCIQYVGHCNELWCCENAEAAEWHSWNFSRAPQGWGLGPGKQWPTGSSQLQAVAALWTSFFPSVGWPVADIWTTIRISPDPPRLSVGRIDEEKVFSLAVTIINTADRFLKKTVLVGMFIWIKCNISSRVKWFVCVCSMSYHDQSYPTLIAQGALSLVTKPWYLVLQACYLIKTNLRVLISTGFVWGGSTFCSLNVSKLKLSLLNWIFSPLSRSGLHPR